MAPSEKLSPFDNCGIEVCCALLRCGSYWVSLTARQKHEVWACYVDWQDGKIDGEELQRRQQAVLDEVQGTQTPGETT